MIISLLFSKPLNFLIASIYLFYLLIISEKGCAPKVWTAPFNGHLFSVGNRLKNHKQAFRRENIGQMWSPTTQSILGVWGWSRANRKSRCLNLFTVHLKTCFSNIPGILALFYRTSLICAVYCWLIFIYLLDLVGRNLNFGSRQHREDKTQN